MPRMVFRKDGKEVGSLGKLPDEGGGIDTKIPVEVVSQEEAEKAGALICMRVEGGTPDLFPDNLRGECSRCGCEVYFRWHAPKNPPKLCVPCLMKQVEEEANARGQDEADQG